MKRIFTFIFALAVFTAADAQRGSKNRQSDNGRYDNRNNRYENSRQNPRRSMQGEIARINRDYAYKIEHVRNDHHLRRKEKRRMIHYLEEERQQQIRRVYARYGNRGGTYSRIQIHF